MEPCIQGERLVTLEMILKAMGETLADQKIISARTYEVLSVISEQGAQIQSLIMRADCAQNDMDQAFRAIRRIDLRHAREDGADKVETEQKAFWAGMRQRSTPFVFTLLFFLLWLGDKFNVVQFFAKMFKEMKG